ncbi:MAG: hypothetical protein KC431_31290, partial [Myxococcales bacterium]|nr:hypothetical protein [Myxococcales bacterium]
MREPLAIIAVGACCPVGLDVVESATSLRAGVSRKLETGLIDRELEPIVVGHVQDSDLPPLAPALRTAATSLQRRLLRLAGGPLREVLEPLRSLPDQVVAPLLLATPAAMPGQTAPVDGRLLQLLMTQADRPLDLASSRLFTTGRAGFFAAVEAAAGELQAERLRLP